MEKIIYFDICAAAVMLITISSLYLRGMFKGSLNKSFMLLMFSIFASAVFDIWAVILDSFPGESRFSVNCRYIAHYCYLLCHSTTMPLYYYYLIIMTDTRHKLMNKKFRYLVMAAPLAVAAVAAANPFTDCLFYFDENNRYCRGFLMPVLYLTAFFYMVLCVMHIYYNRRLLTTRKIIGVVGIFPFTLLAIIVQFIYPNVLIEMFMIASLLLLTGFIVHCPESRLDMVTGMNNHMAYLDDIKRDFLNGKKEKVIFFDIVNNETLNSVLGFETTKVLLKKTANTIFNLSREYHSHVNIYYLDSGRFRIILFRDTMENIDAFAETLRINFEEPVVINDVDVKLNVRICVAKIPEDVSNYKEILNLSNEIRETEDFSGKVLYAENIISRKFYKVGSELNSIIENALINNGFEVYYQPIYSVEKKRFVSAEALLRLTDEKYGFIPPDIFIPAAEKNGYINRIGDMVCEKVCEFIASEKFRQTGLEYVEINLSAVQCMQDDLADKIISVMEKYAVRPEQINLEITETAASFSQNIMLTNMNKLIEMGISFSLDDYGTGYSNIKRVSSLPVKIVKLDKTFVNDEGNAKMWIVLKNTIKMLKDLSMEIVVEGVETQQMLNQFAELNCEFIQGYYFSKPVPEDEFVNYVNNFIAVETMA